MPPHAEPRPAADGSGLHRTLLQQQALEAAVVVEGVKGEQGSGRWARKGARRGVIAVADA